MIPCLNLGYRAWCRYQFFRDYRGAINDIELLEKIKITDLGYGINDDYHLLVTKAMCYSAIGQNSVAVKIFESILNDEYKIGNWGFYQLGVIYYKMEDFDQAIKYFQKQIDRNDIAEAHYYLGRIFKSRNNLKEYESHKNEALSLYSTGKKLFDSYTFHMNPVYYNDILKD